MNVHLAVPHYNAPEQLDAFLTRAESLGFDSVMVLDDASDDQVAISATKMKHAGVQFIIGDKNVGAGANRNRVLQVADGGVLMFIDCDTKIISDDIVDVLRREFSESRRRMIGGLIIDKARRPMRWNYGHEMHPVEDARFDELARIVDSNECDEVWQRLGELGMDYAWLRYDATPKRRVVDWVAEGCFAVHYEDFSGIGGYDETLRYHEGQDLARRLRDNDVEVMFDPQIVVQHLEIDVRHTQRADERREAAYGFYQKYWGMSRAVFDQLMTRY